MGLSSKKSKTTIEPWAPAEPYILKGMEQTNQVFDANQPRLADMATQAYDALKGMAPGAFGTNAFVDNAKAAAGKISNGYYLGTNPGQSTYNRLQSGGMFPRADPSMNMLSTMAKGQAPGAGDAALQTMVSGGNNPADRYASAVAKGQYLNNQPSAGLYSSMMDPAYLAGNPYLENVIGQTNADVTKNANRLFASRGMGTGISSSFADVLSKNLANNEGQLRYQNYNDASARQLQAAGQSDAAWSGERGRMDNSTGLLASNYNAGQDRALAAAQGLNQSAQAQSAQRLAAAQALAGQYNAGQDRSLEAAKASDVSQQSQIQQMLQALGFTGDLSNAQYAGVAPTMSLLNTAADLPYIGVGALNGNIRNVSGSYGTSTATQSPSLATQIGKGMQIAGTILAPSDRRLKRNIEQIGKCEDGLGVYDFDYVWGGPRQRGVMADEVERLRPWALGPKTTEGYATVDYGAL